MPDGPLCTVNMGRDIKYAVDLFYEVSIQQTEKLFSLELLFVAKNLFNITESIIFLKIPKSIPSKKYFDTIKYI